MPARELSEHRPQPAAQSSHRFRRLAPHLVIALSSTALIAGLYVVLGFTPEWWPDRSYGRRGDDVHWKLSVATGSTAALGLMVTLGFSAWRRARTGRAGPAHQPLRRIVGLWSAFLAWIHVGFGITIHADGLRVWPPFTHLWRSRGDLRLLGGAMWVGLGAALLLLAIAAISNKRALRRFGVARWKQLQRSTYLVAAAVAVHVVAMQLQEGRSLPHVLTAVLLVSAFVLLQGLGIRNMRLKSGPG